MINAIITGNVVNVGINGKLHKKNCGTPEEAEELFKLVMKAKEDPSEDNIKEIRCYLNEKTRVGLMAGLETDPDSGEVYMAGFNTPLPATMVGIVKEYHEKNYPMDAIMNFWTLLMLNPDKRVRTDLFDFISTHDFVLTDKGYMVVYKAVRETTKDAEATSFSEFVNRQYLHVKKEWKCSANKYVVYRKIEDDVWEITKKKTAQKWDEKAKGVEILGKLGDLYKSIFEAEKTEENVVPTYTDLYRGTMNIVLGEPVRQERKECDADYRNECSNGLHVGATAYVEKYANCYSGETRRILVCYVNPANVVAVPKYDHSKMRTCEYYPFAIANWDGKKIDVIEQAYFESDYCEYEAEELVKQVKAIQANEKPIETAQNAEADARPMSELKKIIESRLIEL